MCGVLAARVGLGVGSLISSWSAGSGGGWCLPAGVAGGVGVFCSRPLVCVLSFVGGVVGVLFVGCALSCGGVLFPGWGVCLCAWFACFCGVGWCWFVCLRAWLVLVCVVGVGWCGFPRLFFRVVGFRGCGFFVGVVRFSCLSPVFVCRALGFRFSPFRPFVLSKFLLQSLGFGALLVFPRVIID